MVNQVCFFGEAYPHFLFVDDIQFVRVSLGGWLFIAVCKSELYDYDRSASQECFALYLR
jgi:hypothetical protein